MSFSILTVLVLVCFAIGILLALLVVGKFIAQLAGATGALAWALGFLGMCFVLALFAGTMVIGSRTVQTSMATPSVNSDHVVAQPVPPPVPPTPPEPPVPPSPESVKEEVYNSVYLSDSHSRTCNIMATEGSSLPDWASNPAPAVYDSQRTSRVLASKRFATVNEAEQDVFQQLLSEVNQQMVLKYPVLAKRGIRWANHPDLFRQLGILKRQCVTTYALQVGDEQVPVYQVFWDIEITPVTTHLLYASWRPSLIRERLAVLGGILVVITAGLGLTSLLMRQNSTRST